MILLTGSSGLIGHRLAQLLQASERPFICLDPLAKPAQTERYRTYRGSTLQPETLDRIFSQHKIEQVVHLGMSSTTQEIDMDPDHAKSSIVTGTTNLLNTMKEHGHSKIIYASTSMVYGDFSQNVACESDICLPKDPYGQLKYQAEQVIRTQKEVNYIIFRPTAVYGASDRKDRVVAKFIRLAKENRPIKVKGADTKLDFTHVDDVTHAISLMIKNKNINNKVYNVSRGQARSLRDLTNVIKKYYPDVKISFQDSDYDIPIRGSLDISLAKNDLGFIPKINLEEGLALMIQGRAL